MAQRDGSNEFNKEQLAGYLQEIDAADDDLIQLKASHMAACKGPRGRIRETMASAKEAGVNMSALRAVVAAHRAERKIDKRIADLEADDLADYELMCQALGTFGETPLGSAALARAKAAQQQQGDGVVGGLQS